VGITSANVFRALKLHHAAQGVPGKLTE